MGSRKDKAAAAEGSKVEEMQHGGNVGSKEMATVKRVSWVGTAAVGMARTPGGCKHYYLREEH